MKKITDKFKTQQTHEQLPKIRRGLETVLASIQPTKVIQSLQQKPEVATRPMSQLNSKTIVIAGEPIIRHTLPEGLNGSPMLSGVGRICMAHPKGKALQIFDSNEKLVYSLSVEQSIF